MKSRKTCAAPGYRVDIIQFFVQIDIGIVIPGRSELLIDMLATCWSVKAVKAVNALCIGLHCALDRVLTSLSIDLLRGFYPAILWQQWIMRYTGKSCWFWSE